MPPADAPAGSLPSDYFDRVYAHADDPWSFATSAYEHAKYDDTLAALPRERYPSALEIGCSIGVLTERLAAKCDALLSLDVADRALVQAKVRCSGLPHVRFERRNLPAEFPGDSFDLIVLSEVGYYWSREDLERTLTLCYRHLEPGGHLLLVHWTPYVDDYPLTGDEVHEAALARGDFAHLEGHRKPTYRLDLFEKPAK